MLVNYINLKIPNGPKYIKINKKYLYYRFGSKRVGKRLQHDQVCIGKIIPDIDLGIDVFVPNENYYNKVLKEPIPTNNANQNLQNKDKLKNTSFNKGNQIFGYVLACYSVAKANGLYEILYNPKMNKKLVLHGHHSEIYF